MTQNETKQNDDIIINIPNQPINKSKRTTQTRVPPVKIVIIGDSGVGKTTILGRYLSGEVNKDERATIGNVHVQTIISKGDENLKVVLWDTAGQERYSSMVDIYFRAAKGCIIVFDITSHTSFTNMLMWYNKLNEVVKNDIVTVIVGNKLDLERQREVDPELVKDLASKWGCGYIECSAYEGTNIDSIFEYFVGKLQPDKEEIYEVELDKSTKKKSSCC